MGLSNRRIFEIISYDKQFLKHYLDNFSDRFYPNNKELIKNLFLDYDGEEVNSKNLLDIAYKINNKFGYRTFDDDHKIKSSKIKLKVESLLNSYYILGKDFGTLEKELYFYINLLKIYPFDFNNELICNLILALNMINNYYPPVIINDEEKEKIFQIINSGDIIKFKLMIEEKINIEIDLIINLYKKYYLFPENVSIDEIILQKKEY